jgi:hypothetical protein
VLKIVAALVVRGCSEMGRCDIMSIVAVEQIIFKQDAEA